MCVCVLIVKSGVYPYLVYLLQFSLVYLSLSISPLLLLTPLSFSSTSLIAVVSRKVLCVHSFSDGTLMKSHFLSYIAVSEDTRVGGPSAKYTWSVYLRAVVCVIVIVFFLFPLVFLLSPLFPILSSFSFSPFSFSPIFPFLSLSLSLSLSFLFSQWELQLSYQMQVRRGCQCCCVCHQYAPFVFVVFAQCSVM